MCCINSTIMPFSAEKNLNEGAVDGTFHTALLENLEKMAEDKANGKMLFETNCLEGRMVTPGFKLVISLYSCR